MKKSLLLAAMLAVALSACGKKEEAKPAAAPAAPLLMLNQLTVLLQLQLLLLQLRSNS